MTNHPNRSRKEITLQIATNVDGKLNFKPIGEVYSSRKQAMDAAKKLAGKGAHYWGDGLSVRYAGAAGTVYVVE